LKRERVLEREVVMTEARLYIVEAPEQTVKRARELRAAQISAEAVLWGELRGRRLDGLKFRRQCPLGRYIVDLACAERLLAIEIDGEYHDDEEQRMKDRMRTGVLEDYGYRVLRFPNEVVLTDLGAVLESIRAAALSRPATKPEAPPVQPLPSPRNP
jgi:very-short-patch-repair endonuclease